MTREFVVIAWPRTGSYYLTSLLNSAQGVVCHGEIFKEDFVEISPWHRDRLTIDTVAERDADPRAFLDALRALNPDDVLGFKAFPGHLRRVAGLRDLVAPWPKIVLLRDPIEVYASLQRARATDLWTLRKDQEADADKLHAKISFDPESWEKFRKNYSKYLTLASNLRKKMIVHYDQLGHPKLMRRILKKIGSDAAPDQLESEYRKQFSRPVAEGFDNWDAFVAYRARQEPFELPAPTVDLTPAPKTAKPKKPRAKDAKAEPADAAPKPAAE